MLNRKRPDEIQQQKPWVGWAETTLVTAAIALLGAWIRPSDPLFVSASFPWSVMAPLLTGLRYGFAHGLTSALMLVVLLASAWRLEWLALHGGFPAELAVGLVAVGMLAGEFADVWRRRLQWLSTMSKYRQGRLEEFSRGYHLLKVSHDALEQRVAGTTQNMREALTSLRGEFLSGAKDDRQPLWGYGPRVLDMFARYGKVQVAGLFVAEGGRLTPEPVEVMGDGWDVAPHDPVLHEAFDGGRLVSVQREGVSDRDETRLLAAIPLVDVEGKVWAVVAVRQMLFVAFQGDNLHLLAVMGGHMGDIFTFGTRMISGDPLGADQFKGQLERSLSDLRGFNLPAAIVNIILDSGPDQEALAVEVLNQRRGLDQAMMLRRGDGTPVIFILLNLTDQQGLDGYLGRLHGLLEDRHGAELPGSGIQVLGRLLTRDHRADTLYAELCAAGRVASGDV